ncbi:MAG TPA: ribbon-helix-helix protein, CopG family [Candidatus Tumulicola sp.]|jgi:metal-responsive CopG/Arc/MetJ family transcriptional regulator
MKTAVSIPDAVFERVERLAQRTKRSRSRIFSDALDEYLARHANDEITDAMNAVIAQDGVRHDGFASEAARRTLERSDW